MTDNDGFWPQWLEDIVNGIKDFYEKLEDAASDSCSFSFEFGIGFGAKGKIGPVAVEATAILCADEYTYYNNAPREGVRKFSITVQAELIDNVNIGVDAVYAAPVESARPYGLMGARNGKWDVEAGLFAYDYGIGYNTTSTNDITLSFGLAGYLLIGGGFDFSFNLSKFFDMMAS